MSTLDVILLALGGYVGVTILARMMRAKHNQLLAEVRAQGQEQNPERRKQGRKSA